MQNGIALAGIMAHALESHASADGLAFARFHLDILRPTLIAPFKVECAPVRDGHRMQLLQARLIMNGHLMVQAYGLRLRLADTPSFPAPPPATQPEMFKPRSRPTRDVMRDIVDGRTVRGGFDEPGPGAAWLRFEGDIVAGTPISPFVAAAMVCDFGSGVSNIVSRSAYTFANVDISMNLWRTPTDPWVLIESETVTHGEGRALVNSILSDRQGEFARAHQTLFIEARRARP